MDNIYKLTRDNVIAECVDADEKPLDRSERFDSGTVLTIIRGAHLWGNVNGLKYCTVLINGRYFNIPAPVLASSILPKRSREHPNRLTWSRCNGSRFLPYRRFSDFKAYTTQNYSNPV
jgi:hypothetical protein